MTAAPRTRVVWSAVLVVALAAATATAHGLYEVAHAAGAPAPIAALYPLITDGLALVAYATTTQLDDVGRRYAWTIVVLAAGLSGIAQAAYLAGRGVHDVPAWLRAGIGAWPAIAAAIAAHLLHLLATTDHSARYGDASNPSNALYSPTDLPLNGVGHLNGTVSNFASNGTSHGTGALDSADTDDLDGGCAPARERARTAAQAHRDRHGALPSVNQLAALADVARGTAAAALKALRDVPADPRNGTKR